MSSRSAGRTPKVRIQANSQSRSLPLSERHHKTVRNPGPTLLGWASVLSTNVGAGCGCIRPEHQHFHGTRSLSICLARPIAASREQSAKLSISGYAVICQFVDSAVQIAVPTLSFVLRPEWRYLSPRFIVVAAARNTRTPSSPGCKNPDRAPGTHPAPSTTVPRRPRWRSFSPRSFP